jgi:hypothetical protein
MPATIGGGGVGKARADGLHARNERQRVVNAAPGRLRVHQPPAHAASGATAESAIAAAMRTSRASV